MTRALREVVGFELRSSFRRISTWVYFALLFTIGFVMMCSSGGAWESFDGGGGGRLANSASEITTHVTGLLLLTLPITAALFGNAVVRDFQTRMYSLFFTAPISKAAYLGGRFVAALLVNFFILTGAGIGMALASAMPFLKPERIGPFLPVAYAQVYGYMVLPSLVVVGSVLFALAALTRQMLPNYIGGVALIVGYSLAQTELRDLENREVAALLDPLGMGPTFLATRYWTVAEQNTRLMPFGSLFWTNRLIWLGVAAVVLGLAFWRFRFAHAASARRARAGAAASEAEASATLRPAALPRVPRSFGFGAQLRQYASTATREFWGIVRNVYFAALVAIGLIVTLFYVSRMGEIYDTSTYPVTYSVVEAVTTGFILFTIIIITFYAGELVWTEREIQAHQLHDSTPVAGWVPLAAKLTALAGVVLVLQALLALVGMATQLVQGFFAIDFGHYAVELFVRQFATYLLFAVLAMTVHVLVNHKYVGHFVMILYYIAIPIAFSRLGWEHHLYRFGEGGEAPFSDMNGYGHSWASWTWFHLYWAAFALLLALLANLLWVRGEEAGTAWRLRLMRLRFSTPARVLATVACLLLIGTGGFTFYNTSVLNDYRSSKAMERGQAEYEKRYSRFQHIAQPRIVAVDLDVAIHPRDRDLRVQGDFLLVNKTRETIDSVHVNFLADVTRKQFRFDREASLVLADDEYGYHIYRLAKPLAPGDSLRLHAEMAYDREGFENSFDHHGAIFNGTFVHNHYFPSIGYSADEELRDEDKRRKYGLKPKNAEPAPDDPRGLQNPDVASDADWISFAATVSTDADQIALAPGYLKREWTDNGRRFFRYEMDAPILNFYSFLSARYAVKRDRWKDVTLEVLYHPGHEYNLDRMLHAAKKSLEYFSANYGPYPHRQLRIVEFPRYERFAQSFPTMVPFSEGVGFIAKVDPKDVDYVFHITAHEVAHQWWGHQAVAGRTQGSTLTSESVSEYAALILMEKEYGPEGVKKFLRHELEDYLVGRAHERKKEVPLVRMTADQMYLRYYKGALALYALRDYLGEERLNGALRGFLDEVRFQGPPYTNSLEFVRHLRAATPDSFQYVIDDLFEHITLYENQAKKATYTRLADGRFQVEIELQAKKVRADSTGHQTEIPMADWIDVGVFAKPDGKDGEKLGRPLYLAKHKLRSGKQTIRVTVDREPDRAGVDPYHRLIDRQMRDNTVAAKSAGTGEGAAAAPQRRTSGPAR